MEPKHTRIYARTDGKQERCVVKLFKEYVSHRPENHGQKGISLYYKGENSVLYTFVRMLLCMLVGCKAFYLAVIDKPKGAVWYKASPLGIHSIEGATKTLTSGMKISSSFVSNTSLRRTAMNRLLQSGLPKEVIQKKTGRVSDAADADYIAASLFEKQMSNSLYSCEDIFTPAVTPSPNLATVDGGGDVPRTSIPMKDANEVPATPLAVISFPDDAVATIQKNDLPELNDELVKVSGREKIIKNLFSSGCIFHGCTFN
jgi:hypothetical protein